MIGIDIIRKKRNTSGTSGGSVGSGISTPSGGDVLNAVHADDADHANRADEAVHASSAKELDGTSSVWNTIRTWISGATDGLKDIFLRKDQDDETAHKLTMGEAEVKGDATVGGDATINGKVVTDDIHSSDSDGNTSMTGKGWTLRNVSDETGSYSVLAVDNIVVRKKLEAAELEIHRKTYVGAQQIASDWGHKILRVDPMAYDTETGEVSSVSGLTLFTLPVTVDGVERPVAFVGRALSDTETRVELLGDGKGVLNQELETTANAFKVYFCESDGTTSIEDDLVVGSMGQCQEFNVKTRVTHNFQNTYYWGVCVMHGVEDNVLIGGKPTKCVYGVFAHTTKLLTLTSEVSKHTFTCYGMEQSGCTFPVAGDDMVGFGCADPWQDADRCNAIIIASKDGEQSAPSVISYSGIGRKRTGDIAGTPDADGVYQAYAGIEEQYSVPTGKDDSRLDFRVSKKAGNVFKGDLYFKGNDGKTLLPVVESETTSVWQLVPVTEKAEIDYSIDKTKYEAFAAAQQQPTEPSDAAAKVFVKKGMVNLRYQIVHQQGDDGPKVFSSMKSMPEGYEIVVTEFYSNDGIKYSCRSNGTDVGATNLHANLWFQDTSASDVAYVRVILYNDKGDMVDRREVRMKLNTNGVFEANRDFLAYIYYGTDGTGGTQYTNKRISTIEGNYKNLTSRMENAEGGIKDNTQKITETAEKYERVLEQVDQEKTDRGNAELELKTSIEATASGIRTTVQSLYKEGNLLWGANVAGMFQKQFRVYGSETITVKAGITYTLTVKAWLKADANDPQQPFCTNHAMRIAIHGTGLTDNLTGAALGDASLCRDKKNTPAIGYINRIVFTPSEDTSLYVTINEIVEHKDNPDPGTYGGVYVDWLRVDAGDHDTVAKDQYEEWAPAAKDIETINLLPDPAFSEAIGYSNGMGERNTFVGSMGDAVPWMSRDSSADGDGCRGVTFERSGYSAPNGTNPNSYGGLRYIVPFRGAGTYCISFVYTDLSQTLSGKPSMDEIVSMEVHPCDADKYRITGGAFTGGRNTSSANSGIIRAQTYKTFGETATDNSGKVKKIAYLEVRVFLLRNGSVRVSRMCLSKSDHYIYWNANAVSTELGRTLSTESYVDQRANSLEAGIRKGLQSVGFRMDGETWSVNTWGNLFAWYANEKDAKAGNTGNAVMYMAQDNGTWTLHVKGYVEATGGTIGGLKLADDGLYQGTENTMRYSYYSNDSMYLRGFRASTNNASTFHIALGWPSVTNPDGSITARSIGYANHGLNGAMEVVRKTKGSSNTLKLRGSGQIEPGDATVYEGDNECALGIRCGDSNTGYGYGIVNIGMLATHRITVLTGKGSSNVKLQTEGFYIATGNGMKITMPDNPQNGAVVCVLQQCDGTIKFNGNGNDFKFGNDSTSDSRSGTAGQWNFFLFYSDGDNKGYWYCSYFNGRLW